MTAQVELLSLVLTLRPLNAPQPAAPAAETERHWWGRAAHALLLQTAAAADADLAARLHEANGLRPFTASTLLGKHAFKYPDPAQTYTLRFTALTAELSSLLLQAAQPGGRLAPGAAVELDYQPFQVELAASQPEEHPWAAAATYQQIFSQHMLNSQPPRRIQLHLASPTAFSSSGRTQPLPLPEFLFGSLLERWNAFAPAAMPGELRRFAAECLNISRYHLRSMAVPLKENGLRIGSVGMVSYTTANYDRYWMSLASALAAFAQFSGVGAGVSMGLGQCRQVAPEKE